MTTVKALNLCLIAIIVAGSIIVPQVSASAGPGSVRLASGAVPKLRWWVNASRGKTSRVPCLHIELAHLGERSSEEIPLGETSCRRVSPLPNALGVVDELDHPNLTVIVMAFPEAADSISLFFRGHVKDRTVPLELLSARKSEKAGLFPFRFFAIAFRGRSCLSRFVAHNRSGGVLYDGGRMRCRA